MSDVLLLYAWTRLDGINAAASMVFGFGLCGFLATAFMRIVEGDESLDRHLKLGGWVLAGLLAVVLLIPTKRDMAIIVGGKMVIDAARSPEAAEIGSAVRDLVLRELREGAKK